MLHPLDANDVGLARFLANGDEMARSLGIPVTRSPRLELGDVVIVRPEGNLTGIVVGDLRRFQRPPAPRGAGTRYKARRYQDEADHADHLERVRREVLLDVRWQVRRALRPVTPWKLAKAHDQGADLERLLSGVDSPALRRSRS